jgi:N-acetyl-alpha-D-muramate 1-phosphate uridylyltransferase
VSPPEPGGARPGLAAVVLAAGAGTRLRPLTELRPKPLCPVGGVPLLDLALQRVTPLVDEVAVNAHAHADQMRAHLAGRGVHLSEESPAALGTAGALGALAPWLAGRDVLVHNADAYPTGSLAPLLVGWDGTRPRLLVVGVEGRGDFGSWRFVGASLLPAAVAAALPATPSGLYELVWRDAWERGELELVEHDGEAVDCGTPSAYLRANLLASGGTSVVGDGAQVAGRLTRSVVWDGAAVGPGEHLVDCIRAPHGLTVGGGG